MLRATCWASTSVCDVANPEPAIAAVWFDGRSARAVPVSARLEGADLVLDGGSAGEHRFAARQVQWPERTRHGRRVAHLLGGGSLAFDDAAGFDAWRRAAGHRDSWVVRAQQHWRATAAALSTLVLVLVAGYLWGVPWAAARLAAAVPAGVDQAVGDSALAQLRDHLLKPTAVPAAAQQQWRERFAAVVDRAWPQAGRPDWQLHFARGGRLGANALALPGGHIVVTDELLQLLEGADDAVLGVLAHEYGHVRRRHGLQAVVRFGLVSAATSVALGDFSTLLAGVPALLAHLGYARDAERDADTDAAHALASAGLDPAAMAQWFERLAARPQGRGRAVPIAFASHPADAERMRFFREAARR